MFAITVTEKGGEQRRLEFDKSEVTIGRVQGNDVILPKGNVSKRHARIVLKDGKFIIVDLKSTNGTYVNGRKITSPLVVKESDKIYIGDFILGVEESAQAGASPHDALPMPESMPSIPPPAPMAPPHVAHAAPMAPPPQAMGHAPQGGQFGMMAGGPPPLSAPMPIPPAPMAPPMAQPMPMSPNVQGSSPIAPTPAGAEPIPRESATGRATVKRDTISPSVPPPAAHPRVLRAPSDPRAGRSSAQPVRGRSPIVSPPGPELEAQLKVQTQVVEQVTSELGLEKLALTQGADEKLWKKVEKAIVDRVQVLQGQGNVPDGVNQERLVKDSLNEALGLGPLEDLMVDQQVDEIIVDRCDRVLVGRDGVLSGSGRAFSSDESLRRVVERLVAPTGATINEAHPFVDCRLRDGSKVAAAIPPVAVRGACLTLRKPKQVSYNVANLIANGALSPEMGDFLATCIAARKNILVCGAPGSGKSAILAALAAATPPGERVVTVEEVSELSLGRDEWIALESRPGDGNGKMPIDMKTLVHGAIRMRPDRLIVGEVRGSETLELVMAMGSAHDGTVASVAGDSPQAALARLAALSRLGAPGSSIEALHDLVATAVDVIVHVARYADNVYRVASIDEVVGVSDGGFRTQQVFSFRHGGDGTGFAAAGVIPTFYPELEARGIPADTSIFRA